MRLTSGLKNYTEEEPAEEHKQTISPYQKMSSSFNQALDKSLQLLYDYSPNFETSIELIQQLAQQLKLETFIDTFSITETTTKKLSIAASSILLDIDFEDDTKIVNVSLSVGNSHVNNNSSIGNNGESGKPGDLHKLPYIESTHRDNHGIIHIVKINPNKNPISFLKGQESHGQKSIVEQILLKNLQGYKLDKFPGNLQYLAIFDKYSNSSQDLFQYIERVALLFYAINDIEREKNGPDNWLRYFCNRIGELKINDIDSARIGIFLDFWQDFRYINHQYSIENNNTTTLLVGNRYNFQINIVPTASQHEYLYENRTKEWEIYNNGSFDRYKFEFEDGLIATSGNSTSDGGLNDNTNPSPWSFNITLNNRIYVPIYVLEYLGINSYQTKPKDEQDTIIDSLFETINNGDEINHDIQIANTQVVFSIIHDLSSYNFIPLSAITISHLVDIAHIIPILRNYIVLSNLYRTLFKHDSTISSIPQRRNSRLSHSSGSAGAFRRRRRSSRLSGPLLKNTAETELTEEAKKKLKESLKLPDDVTDEELLGLNCISETAAYSTIQPINREGNYDLDSFMKGGMTGSSGDDEEKDNLNDFRENYIRLSVDDIDVTSNDGDIHLTFEAISNSMEMFVRFKIANGEIKILEEKDDNMEVDNDKSRRFIKALDLTEDFVVALKAIF
ncbi:uncharacterized protein J8A68_001055 [[Candida] subhashii]|uniref:Mediator of RNA polymerase II transcription subunit 1 n=1 Tax=[Candida] subhashii TaxID=561895 RepID=A0A8J5QLM9_9ASCO|nr:uncharacterized protein J8A68_001055 [[Candida] subhashii]KAG7665367.1 hypothetical protein J8A68_001055 [[Candida] subhashii]